MKAEPIDVSVCAVVGQNKQSFIRSCEWGLAVQETHCTIHTQDRDSRASCSKLKYVQLISSASLRGGDTYFP